ncbi:GT2 family glycosyltransferase [Algoriphagus boseongensis]|uniref:GT2 family glycosyltransferase n=1 Tax=Algoriphagus boseongensis TaxID=1442587 RepID=A0A4V3D2N0_9BACT|nr:glycosyltransferase family A protein [Algoriphagus boseongensis]TDQ19577.1 GT2 family glycosyltransferase [Algoriphagus boseongensis]
MVVSIIIPCFNSGAFLLEALASCSESTFKNYEILIVDDGSTDSFTLQVLADLKSDPTLKILTKENAGPASARNLGVKHSNGQFLLFLDSDNLIRPEYIGKALKVFNQDTGVGMVYSRPAFFGDTSESLTVFETREFSLDKLLEGNYIDMCSLIRRDAIMELGGFDEHPDLIGFEDWDLWIRLGQTSWKSVFMPEQLFDYRVRKDSVMGSLGDEKRKRMFSYIGKKHGVLIHQRYRQYYRIVNKIQARPFSFFLRILYYKYILRKPLLD